MLRIIIPIFSVLFPLISFSQARLMLNDNAFVVITNNAKLVVDNPVANAVSTLGTGGNIITEGEFNQVKWNIGTTTGSYVMPFTSQTTFTKIPFTAAISAAGTGTGNILFSTYPGATFDNNTYRPSDVTHMFDYFSGSFNNSLHVIDRFWIIDANGYTARPTATFQFAYRDSEHLQVGNTIVEADLGAQRFNNTSNIWGDYLPLGTTNTATNLTSGVPVSPANFFRSWTLSEITFPLAIDLAYFNSNCEGDLNHLSWQTVSENNVSHFEIEYVLNLVGSTVATIPAIGNSSQTQNYQYSVSSRLNGIYKLIEVTNNGERKELAVLNANCGEEIPTLIYYYNNALQLQFQGEYESMEGLSIMDMSGKIIYKKEISISKGNNAITIPNVNLSSGIYMVQFKNGSENVNQKIRTIN